MKFILVTGFQGSLCCRVYSYSLRFCGLLVYQIYGGKWVGGGICMVQWWGWHMLPGWELFCLWFFSNIRIRVATCWIKDLLEVTGLSKKREGFIWCSYKGDMLSGWQLFCLYSQHYQNSVSYMLNQRSPWDYRVFKYMGGILWCSDEGDVCCQVDNYSVYDFFSAISEFGLLHAESKIFLRLLVY